MDPMRAAFYNVTMALFSICCILALAGSYFLFYDFVKPALWAVICGIVLYPLKRLMTTVVQDYLDLLSRNDTPLILGFIFMPIKLLDAIGDLMLDVLITRRLVVGILFSSIPLFSLVINHKLVPRSIMVLRQIMTTTDLFLLGFQNRLVIVPLVIYVLVIFLLSFSEESRHHRHISLLRHPLISAVLWLLAVSHFCSYLGPLRSLGFIFTLCLYCIYWRVELAAFWNYATGRLANSRIVAGISPNVRSAISSTFQLAGDGISFLHNTLLPAIQNKSNQLLVKLESPVKRRRSPTKEFGSEADDSNVRRSLSRSSSRRSTSKFDKEEPPDQKASFDGMHDSYYTAIQENENQTKKLGDDEHSFIAPEDDKVEGADIQEDSLNKDQEFDHDGILHDDGDVKSDEEAGDAEDSDRYIKFLLLACLFVYMSTRLYLMSMLLIPLTFAFVKRVAYAFQINLIFQKLFQLLLEQCSRDADILVPGPIRSLWFYVVQLDKKFISFMRASMDVVGSLAALVIMIALIATIWVFITAQLYYESMHIVTLSSELASHLMEHNARFRDWILSHASGNNVSSITELVQTHAQQLYQDYGEAWISTQIKELVNDNETQAELIETQLRTLALTVYASFNGTTNQTAVQSTSGDVWDFTNLFDIGSAGDIMDIVYANFVTLYEIFNTTWSLIVQNAELIYGSIGGLLSTVMESGSAVMDFAIDTTVFLTILFGLLTSSGQQFKPLESLQYLSPSQQSAKEISSDIEEAVSGIFLATLKMALFYGFFTWLTHTIFAVNLIFIPSILAAIFAAIPLFGPSLVTIPAMLELWLIRGEPFLALFLFVIHNVPGYVVDDAIYSGIKFCDPFLTGMSIAGGMLWWGLEGAIFGPILLCIYQVILSIYENLIATQMRQNTPVINRTDSSTPVADAV